MVSLGGPRVSVQKADLVMALELLVKRPEYTEWSDDEIHAMYDRMEAASKVSAEVAAWVASKDADGFAFTLGELELLAEKIYVSLMAAPNEAGSVAQLVQASFDNARAWLTARNQQREDLGHV